MGGTPGLHGHMPQAVGNRQLLEQPTLFISVRPLKDVGNGLCAVPLRGNYNLCKQTGTTPDMSFRAKHSESRNLPEWQVLSCGYFSSHVVDSSIPLMLRSE